MKYLIEVEVDGDKLRRSRGIDVGEENEYEESVETLIVAEMGWVDDSGIYLTSVKEVELDVTGEYEDEKLDCAWDFVIKYYPDYYRSGEIAKANDLDAILTETDGNWGEPAQLMWKYELSESFAEAARVNDELLVKIYQSAIEGYIESLKEKRQKNG
jgi:hypothetical protein